VSTVVHLFTKEGWREIQRRLEQFWVQLSPWGRAWQKFRNELGPWGGLFFLARSYINPVDCSEEIGHLVILLTALQAEAGYVPELQRIRRGLYWSPIPRSRYHQLANWIGEIIIHLEMYRTYANRCAIQLPSHGVVPEADNVMIAGSSVQYLRSLGKLDPKRISANTNVRFFRTCRLLPMIPLINNIGEILS
jgi:hypothetical protein